MGRNKKGKSGGAESAKAQSGSSSGGAESSKAQAGASSRGAESSKEQSGASSGGVKSLKEQSGVSSIAETVKEPPKPKVKDPRRLLKSLEFLLKNKGEFLPTQNVKWHKGTDGRTMHMLISDFLECEHFKKQDYTMDDFKEAIPRNVKDQEVKQCFTFLLTFHDSHPYSVEHHPDGFEGTDSSDLGQSDCIAIKDDVENMVTEGNDQNEQWATAVNPKKKKSNECANQHQVQIENVANKDQFINKLKDSCGSKDEKYQRDSRTNKEEMNQQLTTDDVSSVEATVRSRSPSGNRKTSDRNTNQGASTSVTNKQVTDSWSEGMDCTRSASAMDTSEIEKQPTATKESGSTAEQKSGRNKNRETPEKISKLLNHLFCKDGLVEKEIIQRPDGAVLVGDIVKKYEGKYNCSESEFIDLVSKVADYKCFHENGSHYIKCLKSASSTAGTDSSSKDNKYATNQKGMASESSAGGGAAYQGSNRGNYDSGRGHGYQQGPRDNYRRSDSQNKNRESDADFNLSKTMSYLLRHGAAQAKLHIGTDGFMDVNEMLGYYPLQKQRYTVEDVERVVANNDKQRFHLQWFDGVPKVRANQGHTKNAVDDLELTPITLESDIKMAVHGTYFNALNAIRKDGLCRMKRQHIHLAKGMPGDEEVISGMRGDCEVAIFVDVSAAINDGYLFYESANGVVLTPGDDHGYLSPYYITQIINRRTGRPIQ